MGNEEEIKFLKGSARFKQSPEVGIQLSVPLSGKVKELDVFNIQTSVSLPEVYDNERQASQLYVPLCKFQFLFSNSYKGVAMTPVDIYPPFNNNLYYYNVESTKEQSLLTPNTVIRWPGFPQYNEFCFIRTDYNVPGYTAPPNEHVLFENIKSTSYNWYFYLSYVSENDDQKNLYYEFDSSTSVRWTPSEGLPFRMEKVVNFDGRNLWQFTCPVKHNLNVGESVKLDGINILDSFGNVVARDMIFEVYSLGDGNYNSGEKIFNILDLGFYIGPSSFENGQIGFFYRVVNSENPVESQSKYYVRKHKIITDWEDAILTNAGFEQNAFRTDREYQTSDLTPNNSAFVATKEDSQSYNVSFNKTVDLSGFVDNQERPISEIFVTIVNRGYFGYFHEPNANNFALHHGWEFNLTETVNDWWDKGNDDSFVNIQVDSYTKTFGSTPTTLRFYYLKNLNIGDTIDGDLCEWNEITQQETVLSEIYHKITFNPDTFNIGPPYSKPFGYYYKPFHKIQIKQFSNYVETGNDESTEDVPFYAYHSQVENNFYWRDLYTIGFIDAEGLGVNYPFLNGRHYPYNNFIFRLIPEGTNAPALYNIETPLIDGCE